MLEFPYRNGHPAAAVEVRLPPDKRRKLLEDGASLAVAKGWGLIDTGSHGSGFDLEEAGRIGVRRVGWQSLRRHAESGTYDLPTLDGELGVPGLKSLRLRTALGLRLAESGFIALIGRDFLDGLRLECDGCESWTRIELCR